MSVQFQAVANRQTFLSKPADTSATTVYTVSNVTATLEAVSVTCHTTGNFDVTINDGSTDFVIADGITMSAGDDPLLLTFGNPVLFDGYSIKVTSSTGDYFTFAVTIAEQVRGQQ